ncbi:MAG: sugar phosphate isomerase/epimerase family protein [Candidatus Freyarchaeota archaeon]
MRLGYASGCFLERRKGFVIPRSIPDELKTYSVELQVERGYDYSDFSNIVSIHLPFTRYKESRVKGIKVFEKLREVNIASLDQELWSEDLTIFKEHVKEAACKGIKYAVFHYGSCNCGSRLWRDENHRKLHWTKEKEFLEELSQLAKNSGIKLLAENHPYGDGIFLNHIKHISEIINSSYADLCLDFPHAFYRSVKFGDASLDEIINKFRSSIQEIHLADNRGSSHAPLALDKGNIDWRKLIPLLKHSLLVIIELRENPLESLKKALEVL